MSTASAKIKSLFVALCIYLPIAIPYFTIGQESLFSLPEIKGFKGGPVEKLEGWNDKLVFLSKGRCYILTHSAANILEVDTVISTLNFSTLYATSDGILAYNSENQLWQILPSLKLIRKLNKGSSLISASNNLFELTNGDSLLKCNGTPNHEFKFLTIVKSCNAVAIADGVIATNNRDSCGNVTINWPKTGNKIGIPLAANRSKTEMSFTSLLDNRFLGAFNFELIEFDQRGVAFRSFLEGDAQDVLIDREGKIWVATQNNGLRCYPTGSISGVSVDYFRKTNINAIFEDPKGNFWIATNAGLYVAYAEPEITFKPVSLDKTTPADSVTTHNARAIKYDPAQTNSFNTNSIRADSSAPKVFITGIKINGQDTALTEVFELSYDQNFIQIQYAGYLNLGAAANLQYKYRMVGVDNDWVYTQNNQAQYTTLPPGSYRFEVEAMNVNGKWSKQPAQIFINIEPALTDKWWFRLLIALLIFIIIGISVVLYVKWVRKTTKEKAQMELKLAEMELHSLRAQMNPHFLFNTLSSIQHYITINETREALKYLSKFSKLMRIIMENSKKKLIPIKDELTGLQLYLELEQLRFKNKFDFEISIDQGIDADFDEIPPLLIQPYVENAILHGVATLEHVGKIKVNLKKTGDLLHCQVIDNGIGREAASRLKNTAKKNHNSMGMIITKSRLELLNKLKKSSLSVNITDVLNENQEAAGTQVDIYIPI